MSMIVWVEASRRYKLLMLTVYKKLLVGSMAFTVLVKLGVISSKVSPFRIAVPTYTRFVSGLTSTLSV